MEKQILIEILRQVISFCIKFQAGHNRFTMEADENKP